MNEHKPFIPASRSIPELTIRALVMGTVLGTVFGAASVYLVLKVGMTVSASIPVAVMSITLFKYINNIFGWKQTTILENNIVQTAGSAGESIAFGIGVTMPALLMLGHDMEISRILIVASLGGLLGVLMMIPLRYALIVKEHGNLAYPEGTACAEVLKVGEKGGMSAATVFWGFGMGLVYKFLNLGLKFWKEVPSKGFDFFKGSSASLEVSPELLGVGYVIGPRIASITFAGGVLSYWLIAPMIRLFGDHLSSPLFPATKLISEMSPGEIRGSYILYIGAGAVAMGGIISLVKSFPTIYRSAISGFSSFKNAGKQVSQLRTEQDISMKWVVLGCLMLIAVITMVPNLHLNIFGALLIIVFGFLFVTVSSRLTGEIGSSSNPISGMTVATLLFTSLIFLGLGWTSVTDRVTALSVAAIVCVASSNGGTISQDLKTGFLLGATPRLQQIAILVGSFVSALMIGFVLNMLNNSSTVYSKKAITQQVYVDNVSELTVMEPVKGPEAKNDSNMYHVFRVLEQAKEGPLVSLQPGKYLVDDAGLVTYLVDPAINGVLTARDDGSTVTRFDAPKARLMSLIIDGILTQKLPWSLVLLGVVISILMELCGVPSLAFAVGVYLPMSTSAPLFVGGMVRYFVTRKDTKKKADSDEETSPGILYASGLIAGGALCGILIAAMQGIDTLNVFFTGITKHWEHLEESNLLAVGIFAILVVSLYRFGIKRTSTVAS